MHKYGAAAQQAYTMVSTPLAASPQPPTPSGDSLSVVLQLIGHGQLDDISGVSMYSTAHSVFLKSQPMTLHGVPECMLALCRPPFVLASPPAADTCACLTCLHAVVSTSI